MGGEDTSTETSTGFRQTIEAVGYESISETSCGLRPASYPVLSGAASLALKRQKRDADHSPPHNAEVKDGGAIPSLSHAP